MAAGPGWAWLRDGARVVHVAGVRGPRGPLTAVAGRVPVLTAGDRVRLRADAATPWRTPAPPERAGREEIAAACAAVRPHMWNDPRALLLATAPLEQLVPQLAGRGPGLTPAGDDAICGYVYARRALDPTGSAADAAAAGDAAALTGEPARSLLVAAATGEAFEPVAAMLAALVGADAVAIAPALRRLVGLGRSTGRATLTGLVRALAAPAA